MAMTRKHFTKIAAAFNQEIREWEHLRDNAFDEEEKRMYSNRVVAVIEAARALVPIFREENANFDLSRYMDAVVDGTQAQRRRAA